MKLALLCLLLAACGEVYPLNEPVEPPPGADEAADLVAAFYTAQLGEPPLGRDYTIAWYAGDCLEPRETTCVRGATITPDWPNDYVDVALVYAPRPSYSSLAHELLHVWGGNAEHTDSKWKLLPEAEELLRSNGL